MLLCCRLCRIAISMANVKTAWSGSSLNDLYENNDPYCFSNNPVTPSKYHAVLYELPATLSAPPKPHRNIENHHLDRNYVKLSYYSQMFTIKNVCNFFPLIVVILLLICISIDKYFGVYL